MNPVKLRFPTAPMQGTLMLDSLRPNFGSSFESLTTIIFLFHGLESPRDPLCPSSLFRHLRMQAAQPNKLTLRNWSSSDVLAARALVGLAFGREAFSRMLGQDVPDAKCNLIGAVPARRVAASLRRSLFFTTTRIFVCLVPRCPFRASAGRWLWSTMSTIRSPQRQMLLTCRKDPIAGTRESDADVRQQCRT